MPDHVGRGLLESWAGGCLSAAWECRRAGLCQLSWLQPQRSAKLSTKEKSKQNITRHIEIKNNLTIARREWGRDNGEKGFQELLKRTHGQNQRGGWKREGGGFGFGGVEGWAENADNCN